MSTKHYAYMLRCSDDSLYSGYTTDLKRREEEHNKGIGSRYTRGRQPSQIVYYEEFENKGDALSREAEYKKLSTVKKNEMVQGFKK